ncbi:hypothetical protein BKH46_01055 [Helicobacter sp. 12S02634-8]|uniref:SH3 domain-containing protein n=1 Tax=Helicobacter sp. 12S02634-8 TaxID=1476199 RepID=UPI000BA55DCF|nr:SH3 domain-containing protein [Helicobacter sp. 12S02634-8]PAF48523.1 hypothetical protein BKH46_01055 [Helicobacter sp. 12S02634-8]
MQIFLRILLALIALTLGVLHAQEERAKIIYVKALNAEEYTNKPVYVGETIPITYSLLLFSNARFSGTEFIGGINTSKIVLKNPDTKWKLASDGSYQAIYRYKIKSTDAVIPSLRVIAVSSDGDYTDSSSAPAIKLNAIDLYQNKDYVGVLADKFRIIGYKTKIYDDANNILVFEMEADHSNLEDFKLPDIQKQGFESTHFGDTHSDGIYYCIIPKHIQNISFEYYSLEEKHFKNITLPIVPVDDTISTQDDIKPKNNFLIFSNLVTIVLMAASVVCYFLWRRKKVFLAAFVVFLIYLLWNIFSVHQAVLLSNKQIRILPTHNSTILETTKSNTQVEIIGKHGKYYKIMTADDRIGWVRKDDVR